jgi:hypothetical protein
MKVKKEEKKRRIILYSWLSIGKYCESLAIWIFFIKFQNLVNMGYFKSGRGLYVGVRSVPYLRSKHTNPLSYTSYDLLVSHAFSKNKAKRWVTFPKCGVPLDYCLILGPLFWAWRPTLGLYHTHKALLEISLCNLDIPCPPHQRKTHLLVN